MVGSQVAHKILGITTEKTDKNHAVPTCWEVATDRLVDFTSWDDPGVLSTEETHVGGTFGKL